jgi:hypothetical protein
VSIGKQNGGSDTHMQYRHSVPHRFLPLLFEDAMDSSSGKLQVAAVFVLGEVVLTLHPPLCGRHHLP